METRTVTIEQISVKDKDKNDKPYVGKNGKPFWKIGIKVKDHWANGLSFDLEKDKAYLEQEGPVTLLFENDPQYGLQFKIPRKMDVLEARVARLEKFHEGEGDIDQTGGSEKDYVDPEYDY